ncbi:hypothetical protein [Stappia sp.]|uniref:hypothetical protein n=1 Tax=Stappia sp. TaxID=1870903 RepID=UPI003A9A0FC8
MPDRPKKPGQQAPGASSSGNRSPDGQASAREARLAAALRANLRRRKAAGRQVDADHGTTAAPEASGTLQDDNDS